MMTDKFSDLEMMMISFSYFILQIYTLIGYFRNGIQCNQAFIIMIYCVVPILKKKEKKKIYLNSIYLNYFLLFLVQDERGR